MEPINVSELNGIWQYLKSIDWSEPWFLGLGTFHVLCIIATILTRNKGAAQAVYFGMITLLVFFAESINEWAAQNWKLFARQQYFDSNGMFFSLVFSIPLLFNCLVMVVCWLWDVGVLINNVKQMKYRKRSKANAEKECDQQDESQNDTSSEEKKEK
ncbi:hypothetical protein ACJMK2_040702 [Sinanodonta woodiana]|uniref:Transmembrane protein 18 n=1 Tax=Sinanodonta woodiana TaxID=1069815 RepID=A0ABD3W2G4_SINWO